MLVDERSRDLTVLLRRFFIEVKNYRPKGLDDKFNSVREWRVSRE